ncbi:MAG: glycoside hydrolase family 127 protein, partial [Mesorhizobium sp.]
HLRIPAWSASAQLKVNGEAIKLAEITSDGYAAIKRTWTKGDDVRLDLEMPIERLYANPQVRQDAGRVALSRGPLIYCVEASDNDS